MISAGQPRKPRFTTLTWIVVLVWESRMEHSAYLREEAEKFRTLAESAGRPDLLREYIDLAETCDEVAEELEYRQTGG